MKKQIKLVAISVLIIFQANVFSQTMNEKLAFLKPILGKSWIADFKSPNGQTSTKVIRSYELIWNGEVIKFTNSNPQLKYFEEGYFYVEDGTNKVMFFSVCNKGGAQKGEVLPEEGKITIQGQTTIRDKTFDYKDTYEFTADGKMTDRWFQNASGSWRPGHVVEFTKSK